MMITGFGKNVKRSCMQLQGCVKTKGARQGNLNIAKNYFEIKVEFFNPVV